MRLIREAEACALIGVSNTTMWRHRRDGNGPPVMKIGRFNRYDEAALLAWAAGRRV